MRMTGYVLAGAVLAVSACEPVVEDQPEPDPGPSLETCGADKLQNFVGGPIGAVLVPFGTNVRVIGPRDAVTQDFSETRLNIDVDAQADVTRIWCG